jgi:hypothetical protein
MRGVGRESAASRQELVAGQEAHELHLAVPEKDRALVQATVDPVDRDRSEELGGGFWRTLEEPAG